MSSQLAPPENVCYVHCNFCNTILAVNVPDNNFMFNIVTVRCGHCANLLSVNMGALIESIPLQHSQKLQNHQMASQDSRGDCSSSAKSSRISTLSFTRDLHVQQQLLPIIRPPEKRQRVPSAYNRFIKEEIQRIKANNPDISHREAFSAAAKNWAHFPHIHYGLTLDGNKQAKLDEVIAAHGGGKKSHGLY